MADPATLPPLKEWNEQKLASAIKLSDHPPSGVQCPKSVSELLDVPGTDSVAAIGEVLMSSIAVICPDCGFKGERYL